MVFERMQDPVENKKIDLIQFQENLNTKFQEISNQKKNEGLYLLNGSEFLGLTTKINDLNIVLSLKDLKSLSAKTIFENSIKTKSWLLGYNQEQGNIYTIFNLNKVLPFILEGKFDYENIKLKDTFNIVYLKSNEENYGILLESLKLINLKDLNNIYDNKKLINELINIKKMDQELVVSNSSRVILEKINEINCISKIFVDDIKKEVFFMLDVENCIKFLKDANPF